MACKSKVPECIKPFEIVAREGKEDARRSENTAVQIGRNPIRVEKGRKVKPGTETTEYPVKEWKNLGPWKQSPSEKTVGAS